MKFPDSFEFKSVYSNLQYMLTKVNICGVYMWRCNYVESPDDENTAKYTIAQLESNFTSGHWITEEDLSEEPELVYPFTFEARVGEGDILYTVDKVNGVIKFSSTIDFDYIDDLYTECDIKKFIKSGAWIIKSVGKPLEAPTSDKNIIKLGSFQFDNKEALESIKELCEGFAVLTKAIEDLGHAYDYLNAASAIYEKKRV